jgi:nicotinate-nucleotide adenylyltransferase
MRIGIFGGTFDPPHVGHLILAEECRSQLALDKLLWVVTNLPPHKQNVTISPVKDRIELVKLSIADNPGFELSLVDVDRPGPHYALDTVRLIREQYPEAELFYLMGGDSLHDLPSWHRAQEFLAACDGLGVMRRHQDRVDLESLDSLLPGIKAKVHVVEAPILEIASHQIRLRIHDGEAYRYYLTDRVYRALQDLDLYR